MGTLIPLTPRTIMAQMAVSPALDHLNNFERIALLGHLFREAVYATIGHDAEKYDPAQFLCFDNGGKTLDRYTIFPYGMGEPKLHDEYLAVCATGGRAHSQWGTGNRLGMLQEAQTGQANNFLIDWALLPVETILHVRKRLAGE